MSSSNHEDMVFAINNHPNPKVWVVDDFYSDPYSLRNYALMQHYFDMNSNDGGYVGLRTRTRHLFPGIKEKFESIMGMRITKWEEYGMNGRFQVGYAGTPRVYHCDDQTFAGMIYLTPDAPVECGTSLLMHKATKIRHSSHPDILSTFNDTTLDKTPYQEVDVLGNIFNRLVIFDARCIHSATDYFGSNINNSRMWQMFFFDAE
jgi:hypothetical protein